MTLALDTDPVQHATIVIGVSEGSDLLAALPVDDAERLADTDTSWPLRSQQKAMVELVKTSYLQRGTHRRTIRRIHTRSLGGLVFRNLRSLDGSRTPRFSILLKQPDAGNNPRS